MATPVILPRQGQSVESCIITELLVKKGDSIKSGDVLFKYETDKAAFELEAEQDGCIIEILVEEGDEVPVLATILAIGNPGEKYVPEDQKPKTKDQRPATKDSGPRTTGPGPRTTDHGPRTTDPGPRTPDHGPRPPISPRAKNLALKIGVPFSRISGSGPDGRIIERDIEAYAKDGGRLTSLASAKSTQTELLPGPSGNGLGGRILDTDLGAGTIGTGSDSSISKISNIRKIIAQNMHASLQNSAQLTHHMSADARAILGIRKVVKQKLETEGGENITLNDLVCYSVIKALKNMPEINSHFLGDSIKTFNKVHLGIAVDTDRGLMVPALRNADDMTIDQLSKELKNLANSCKNGNVDPDLLTPTAASFTVSNLGAFGVEMFTPVINLPQSGILGVNTIIQRPGDAGNGIIGFIPYIGLSLTYDHRVIDGAPASAFLREIKTQIENLTIN